MASRDQYSVKIECPNCGQKGLLHLSENDYPFMKRDDRRLEEVEGRFSAQMKDEDIIELKCKDCLHSFER